MAATRAPRSAGVCFLLAVVLAIAAVLALPVSRARATTGVAGPVHVTVTPTANLENGQVVSIHTDAGTSGVKLFGIVAHICAPNAHITTDFRFGPDGGKCPGAAGNPGGGTGEASLASTGASSLLLDPATIQTTPFKAGVGTVDWKSFGPSDPATGTARSLTCDPTHACDLVVKVSADGGNDYFFTAPLTYAGAGGSSTSSPSSSSASTTTTAPGDGGGVRAADTTTTSSTTSTTSGATTTTTTPPGPISVDPSQVAPGGSFTVTSTTWLPSSTVAVTLNSTPVSLGSLTADAQGKVTGPFTVPSDTALGEHTVKLAGKDANNGDQTLSVAITVVATTTTTTTAAGTTTTLSSPTTTTIPSGGGLPYTGSNSRDLASAALLMIALGLFLLGRYYKRLPGT
jgi:hypothetical protein